MDGKRQDTRISKSSERLREKTNCEPWIAGTSQKVTRKPEHSSHIYAGVTYYLRTPGTYTGTFHKYVPPAWVNGWGRWSAIFEFVPFDEPTIVLPCFMNFGEDPKEPVILRNGKYRKIWTIWNGEPPTQGERLDGNDVLEQGVVWTVKVATANLAADFEKDGPGAGRRRMKHPAERYSVVLDVLDLSRPKTSPSPGGGIASYPS